MRGNTFGKLFSITTFGESHGPAMGVVLDGVPAGLTFIPELLQKDLDSRAPGRNEFSTSRLEADKFQILSGIFEGQTLGTPITVIIANQNQRSQDYEAWKNEERPGHADRTTILKYGIRDYRGGGRASGRETVARVIGGHFAKLILPKLHLAAVITQAGPISCKLPSDPFNLKLGATKFADPNKEQEFKDLLLKCKNEGESLGGKIDLFIRHTPAGLGEPVFDKLKADLAKALMSIGSCVGVTYGRGVEFASLTGKQISQERHYFGGIEGGISNGEDIHLTLYFKAPSTVGDKAKEGRHDPCILPRVTPVVEAMAAITIADHYLRQNAYSS